MRPRVPTPFEEADACSALAAAPDLPAAVDVVLSIVCYVKPVDLK
jgi:hypothetical protein